VAAKACKEPGKPVYIRESVRVLCISLRVDLLTYLPGLPSRPSTSPKAVMGGICTLS
jgi:hypothetical protein